MPASSGFSLTKLIVVIGVIGLAGGGYYVYTSRAAAANAAPDYTTTTVGKGEVVQVVTATGQLDAVLSVDVGSQISGQIKALYADFNSRVTQGQKLVEIDPATYQQRVRQGEADFSSAQASYTLAELNAKRTQALYEQSLVTQADNDQTQAQLQQAKAALLTRQAALDNFKVDLSRCTIFSPIDGIVISKQTEVGKTVAASMNVPVLFTIANDLAKMQITAAVAEADIGAVAEGQKVTFTVDAFPNRTFHGAVTQVRNAPKNTSNVVTYDTIISVDNGDLKLRPGMTANASIIVAKREGVLKVPNASLRVRMPENIAVTQVGGTGSADAKAATPAGAATPAPAATGSGGGQRGGFMGPNASPETREKMRGIMAEVGITSMRDATPEQRTLMRKLMVERGVITAEQAAEMAERSGARPAASGENTFSTRTVYRLPGGNKTATPEALSVKVGITDGMASEIADGLKEGDTIILSAGTVGGNAAARPAANPFSGQQQGGFRRP
jgi:HlyD family secretion protein